MYPSGGKNAYGAQSYGTHQAYGQTVGAPGTSIAAPDSGPHLSLPSQRLSGIFGSSQQTETSVYRGNIPGGPGSSTAAIQYGGQYGAYSTPANHQGLSGGSYAASPSRVLYGPNQGAFGGRDLLGESAKMYSDHVGFGRSHQHEPDDQRSFFRQQQQLMHSQKQPPGVDPRQSLVDSSFDGSIRATDYLAARGAAIRHESQDYGTRDLLVSSYGMRTDVDPGSQGSHQIPGLTLRAGMGRSLEDDAYARGSSGTSYGVNLPPGRDYSTGKVLGVTPSDGSYRGPILSHKEERGAVHYKLEERDDELRRDRERNRERERGRLLERQERERDRMRERDRERERGREHAHAREIRRRDRTPLRSSRDHRASPKRRAEKEPTKRSPPRLHRHSSPVKERRRGYICKVTPYCLVEVERDLTSISRRYPKLSISPEFSKLVLRWPKGDLDISFSTPVSFEHDFVEMSGEAESKDTSTKSTVKAVDSEPSESAKTVWNAKVILMSGISTDASLRLVSEKSSSDRVILINSILRFGLFREGRAFNAIGGPWDAEKDGGDPSDEESLIRTAIRCAKELVQVDLVNCLKWNPFLEIHYDRVGKDGFCSYKEVTLLFLPDLENCLPSLDVWHSQWISRREARVEREREAVLKKEKKDKSGEKKDDAKGNPNAAESLKSSKVTDKIKKEKDDNKVKKENEVDSVDPKEKDVDSKSVGEAIKKEKVEQVKKEKEVISVDSKADSDPKSAEKIKGTKDDLKAVKSEDDTNSATKVKKAKGKMLVKKVKVAKKQVPSKEPETGTMTKPVKKLTKGLGKKTAEKDMVGKVDNDQSPTEVLSEEQTTIRKIGKKASKKEPENVAVLEDTAGNAADKQTEKKVEKQSKAKEDEPKEIKKASKVEKGAGQGKKGVMLGESLVKNEDHKTGQKEGDVKNDKLDSGMKMDKNENVKADSGDATKGEEKPVKVKKDKGKSEEPPQFPGLFLQTKRSKDSNVRSTTLSLDGLLDYNENDVEESTFELSLFAEALYEMLQFKMGCRILSFLEKLGETYLKKRTQRKREREENSEKDEEDGSSMKRAKLSSTPKVEDDSAQPKTMDTDDSKSQEVDAKAEYVKSKQSELDEQHEQNVEMEETDDDDPEEELVEEDDPDEDGNEVDSDGNREEGQSEDEKKGEVLLASAPEKASSQEGKGEEKQAHMDEKPGTVVTDESSNQTIVDKELLQAFRFFDREWVGYIKADDMRTIIHNLGKFHSKRAIKELLRIAVVESNKDRDGRILYMNLLKAGSEL